MPIPAALVATYATVVGALPSAAPVLATAAIGLGVVVSHEPNQLETTQLAGKPEVAAECMQRNVASLNNRLVAVVQPLHGTDTMAVVVKRGVVGDPLMSIILHEAGSGSHAEIRPIAPPGQQPDVIAQMIAGC